MNIFKPTYEEIYREYFRSVYTFLYKLCHDADIAEALTEETFYSAYNKLFRYSGRCGMFTWLAYIATGLYIKRLKKLDGVVWVDLYITEPEASLNDEPGYRLVKQLDSSEVCGTLLSMPKGYAVALALRIYGEVQFDEIAALLNISEKSARVIFNRAKRIAKEKLFNE